MESSEMNTGSSSINNSITEQTSVPESDLSRFGHTITPCIFHKLYIYIIFYYLILI